MAKSKAAKAGFLKNPLLVNVMPYYLSSFSDTTSPALY
ncbi:hypothetical protein M23134_04971 [Microscilla marina ATCC 23134]|uniref:Uncharacterized protein n=1 Tax=Microscilla marina ATCC 23134 TaxID=313606 RepID=A1ZXG4_MICM2|nr:hypothetical protein M23134_04971 [Microscilla marina ATCC 23134]